MIVFKKIKVRAAGNPKERGVALFLAVFVSSIILAIALTVAGIIIGEIRLSQGLTDSIRAIYMSDAGAEKLLYHTIHLSETPPASPPYLTKTWSSPDGSYEVEAILDTASSPPRECSTLLDPDRICIISDGIYAGVKRRALELSFNKPVGSPPLFDAASSFAGGASSSYSWSHTVGAGSDRILVVGISIRGTPPTVTGVTYAGLPLTSVGMAVTGGLRVHFWYRLNPPTGTNPVTVTLSGAPWGSIGGATSWFSVNQAAPVAGFTSASGFGTAPSVVVPSSSGDMVLDTVSMSYGGADAPPVVGAGQTEKWNVFSPGDVRGFGSSEAGVSPNVIMSWSTKWEAWLIAGFVLKSL